MGLPINRASAYGLAWTVYEGEIAELNSDPAFVERFRRGEELLAASWGWDLAAQDYLPNLAFGQTWHNWPVRLFKAAQSAQLFGHDGIFASGRSMRSSSWAQARGSSTAATT